MFQNTNKKAAKPTKTQQQPKPETKATTQQPQPLTAFQVAGQMIPYFTFPLLVLAIAVYKLNIFGRFAGLFGGLFGSSKESDQHGTAGFAYTKEIKQLTTQYNTGDIKVGEVKDLKVLTQLVNLPRDLALMHTLIVGPTGAGKSRSFFLPNCHDAGNSSFIATDPKSELWEETAYNNIAPVRFAPTDPDNSAPFNFVAYCKNLDFAENVASAVIHSRGTPKGDPFWWQNEERILIASLLHIANSTVPTATHLYEILSLDVEETCAILLNSPQADTRRLVRPFMGNKPEQRSGVLTGLTGRLNWMNNPNIRRFTSSDANAFNFGQLREKPVQVYWCLEQDDVSKLQTLTTIFFSIIFTQLLKQKTGKVPVSLFFDEFANIGRIKNFENHITLMRGQNVAINAGIQSISQLDSLYEKADAETILDNFNNKLLLAGIQGNTAEKFSKQLGNYTYTSNTESFSESGGIFNKKVTKSTGTKEHARALLTADELRRLDRNKIILISTNLRPIMMKRLFFTRPKAGFNKLRDWNPNDPSSQVKKQPKFKFQCGQEIPTPEYETAQQQPPKAKKKATPDFEDFE